jgi:viroplasmin and RNaseH domain-containing protein
LLCFLRMMRLDPRTSETQGECADFNGRPKAGFYAVRVGRNPGIYTTWAEAEAQVKGFVG